MIIIAAHALFFASIFAGDARPPELDPEKPIYQKQWGGVVIAWPIGDVGEVRVPDQKTVEQAKLEAEIARIKAETEQYKQQLNQETKQKASGHFWIKVGAGLFVIGAFAFVALIKFHIEEFGLLAAIAGIGCACYGALIVKLAGKETVIVWALIAVLVTGITAWICKGNSIGAKIKAIKERAKLEL